MRTSDLLGVLAGFVISYAGFLLLAYTGSPCASLSERTSFVGGIAVAPASQPAASTQPGDATQIENPYALETCDSWPSPVERWLTVFGWIATGLLGGAAASRIGAAIAQWRGAFAVAAGFVGAISHSAISAKVSLTLWELLAVLAPLALLAAGVGAIGGALAKRFAKQMPGAHS